tara:strand:+ start:107 stop:244 length:138 start_codon:yes stop_codon:yes gene_type:complete
MRTPLEALDLIAHMIYYEASLAEMDIWLDKAIAAGHVELDMGEEE